MGQRVDPLKCCVWGKEGFPQSMLYSRTLRGQWGPAISDCHHKGEFVKGCKEKGYMTVGHPECENNTAF